MDALGPFEAWIERIGAEASILNLVLMLVIIGGTVLYMRERGQSAALAANLIEALQESARTTEALTRAVEELNRAQERSVAQLAQHLHVIHGVIDGGLLRITGEWSRDDARR